MKFLVRTLVVTLTAALLGAASAHAAGVSIGVNAGLQSYTGNAGDALDSGINYGATVDLQLTSMWSVGVNASLANSKHKDDGADAATLYPGLTGTISDEIKVTQVGAHVRYFLPVVGVPVHPYLVAGVGSYGIKEDFSAGTYSESNTDTKIGERVGLGATWSLNPMFGISAEGDYHFVQTDGESTNFYGLRGGVVFHLNAK